jgi:hypothetical protein
MLNEYFTNTLNMIHIRSTKFYIDRHFSRNTLNSLRMTSILLENHMLDITFQLLHPEFIKETRQKKEFI